MESYKLAAVHMIELYDRAESADIGDRIACPVCEKSIIKTAYHKKFCSNPRTHGKKNCKDAFWNFPTIGVRMHRRKKDPAASRENC